MRDDALKMPNSEQQATWVLRVEGTWGHCVLNKLSAAIPRLASFASKHSSLQIWRIVWNLPFALPSWTPSYMWESSSLSTNITCPWPRKLSKLFLTSKSQWRYVGTTTLKRNIKLNSFTWHKKIRTILPTFNSKGKRYQETTSQRILSGSYTLTCLIISQGSQKGH